MTNQDYFALFGRTSEDVRWLASADNQEWLGLVTWLVRRAEREAA